MRLARLEMKGFKSFRDKTVIDFPDKFMGIVGPNGSGKSNITESICFVLGKSRGLRAANLAELIFNGGIGGTAAGKAVVSITLKEDDGRTHKITRIIEPDGTSVYKLNDKRTTRTQIVEIVGDNDYNILLQDDVTKVVEMRPQDRRKIIDDLCGIGAYDEKRDKALRELEKVEGSIGQTVIILGQKQGYLTSLKKERDEAIYYTNIRDELRDARATLLDKEIKSLEKREEKINQQTEEIEKKHSEDLGKIADSKTKIQNLSTRLKEVNHGIIKLEEDRRGNKVAETRGELLRAQDKITLYTDRLNALVNEEKNKKEINKGVLSQEREITSQLTEADQRLTQLRKELVSESEREIDSTFENELDKLKSGIYESRSRIKALTELNAKKEQELKNLKAERDALESKIKQTVTEEQNKINQYQRSDSEHHKLISDIQKCEAENASLTSKSNEAGEQLQKHKLLLSKKQSELDTIMRTSGGLHRAVAAATGLKKVITGIHGPVMQLGEITEKQYETALSVAAGGRMQYVVVSTVDDAAKCIDYLRKKNIGRCTFLPLDKIKIKTEDKAPKGAIGFARDYIKHASKFKKIFDYVFGDTIIVKDIEAAKAIGVGSWRMVTVDGDLLEMSGAMTGGQRPQNAEITFNNLEELEKEVQKLETSMSSLQKEYDSSVEARQKNDSLLISIRQRLNNEKESLGGLKSEKDMASERRTNMRERLNKLIEQASTLEREIQENRLESTKLDKTANASEKQMSSLAKERAGGPKSQTEQIKDGIRDLEVEKTKLTEQMLSLKRQGDEISSRLSEISSQSSEVASEVNALKDRVKDLSDSLKDLEKAFTSIDDGISALVTERTQIEEDLTRISSEIGMMQAGMEGANMRRQEFMVEMAKITTRLEELRKTFKGYEGAKIIDKSVKELEDAALKLEQKLTEFGQVNLKAVDSYESVKEEYEQISSKLETLKTERQSIFDFMEKIEAKKKATFMEAFDKVKSNFERIFAELSDGKGTLIIDNPINISDAGLLIKASPAGKKLMSLDAMSGGEKVLTSTAFLLALQQYKPSFFYIVDELDAALDHRNSARLAQMLAGSSSQFLMVTHNKNMLKYMNSAIGVSMIKGVSQIVGVRFDGQEDVQPS